jgi:hypothetical protein
VRRDTERLLVWENWSRGGVNDYFLSAGE